MYLQKLCCYPLKQRKKDNITNTITILKQNKQE